MHLDQNTARRCERRDGIPCFTIGEPEPSNVVHLFHPNHPDYEAAKAIHDALLEEQAKTAGTCS